MLREFLIASQGIRMNFNCYDAAPEFIDEDNRRFRGENPISKGQMTAKHSALLPAELVYGKTILDLGCCMGATGHWCLSNGAAHYTGVEVQQGYVDLARPLFERYHPGQYSIQQAAIEEWLAGHAQEQFDIVCMLGVIYAFVDYFSILKGMAKIAAKTIAIEALWPIGKLQTPGFLGVQFLDEQPINHADKRVSVLGRGTRISPSGMEWLMKGLSFKSHEGLIKVPLITDVPDIYNRSLDPAHNMHNRLPVRYMMRFDRVATQELSVSENIQTGQGKTEDWK